MTIVFNFRNITAREMSQFTKDLQNNPSDAMDRMADLLAQTVEQAPIEGDLNDPNTYLDLPLWGEGEGLTWNQVVDALNEAMSNQTKK